MAKPKRTKEQIYKTFHRKLNIDMYSHTKKKQTKNERGGGGGGLLNQVVWKGRQFHYW